MNVKTTSDTLTDATLCFAFFVCEQLAKTGMWRGINEIEVSVEA